MLAPCFSCGLAQFKRADVLLSDVVAGREESRVSASTVWGMEAHPYRSDGRKETR